MAEFNPSQTIAVEHNRGPMLVLAGPGSGKTRVITYRVQHLIAHHNVNPQEILVITFTKAAAMEMRERFDQLNGNRRIPVNFGTFHAIFFTVLRHAYHYNVDNIIKEGAKWGYLQEIIGKLQLESDNEKELISDLLSEIGIVKNNRADIETYCATCCPEDTFRRIYKEYERRKAQARLIDFDDMLLYCYELFDKRKDILALWQQKYRYILIDESQDANRLQYDIVRMMALPENNLFLVGDDDQSIYRFRGAKPEIMLQFDKDYQDAKVTLLDINYRSTKKIVAGALKVIGHNQERFPKKIQAAGEEGEDIAFTLFEDQAKECQQILSQIQGHVQGGGAYSDFAILFRTNTQPRFLLYKLMEYNIPFKMKDALPNLYDHWIARDVMAYIQLALGNRERKTFLQIINRPKRYIGRDCFSEPEVSFEHMLEFYGDKHWMCERIENLQYDLVILGRIPPFAAVNYIRKSIGYDAFLMEYARERRISYEDLEAILEEIAEGAKSCKTHEEWFETIAAYTRELEERARKQQEQEDSVTLATMHSSKGLEFEKVIIIDANEGVMPHHKAVLPMDVEEERRLFYVAMTRAKKRLYIYAVKERYQKEMALSRFVEELGVRVGEG